MNLSQISCKRNCFRKPRSDLSINEVLIKEIHISSTIHTTVNLTVRTNEVPMKEISGRVDILLYPRNTNRSILDSHEELIISNFNIFSKEMLVSNGVVVGIHSKEVVDRIEDGLGNATQVLWHIHKCRNKAKG